jgi:hypothetical protein
LFSFSIVEGVLSFGGRETGVSCSSCGTGYSRLGIILVARGVRDNTGFCLFIVIVVIYSSLVGVHFNISPSIFRYQYNEQHNQYQKSSPPPSSPAAVQQFSTGLYDIF